MSQHFPFEQFIKLDQDQKDIKIEKCEKQVPNKYQNALFSSDEMTELTAELKQQIQSNISSDKFNTYFNDTFRVTNIDSDEIHIQVSTNFLKRIIENHYQEFLNQSIVSALGKQYNIIIETNQKNTNEMPPSIPENIKTIQKSVPSFKPTQNDLDNAVESKVIQHFDQSENIYTGFLKEKTFNNFVSGPSNRMSYSAAVAVSNKPGELYPSLYIHGGSGLGKTHLLNAIGNKILEKFPRKKVLLTSASAFVNEMVDHLKDKTLNIFRKKYSKDIDVLIIDDIHELKNKNFTQDEFFHVFNELYKQKKQLIFTSDKHPNEIDGITERIKTRLYGGLVTEVQHPDLETRIAILKQKASDTDIHLNDDVAGIIASSIKSNIRELEGSLIKLGAYSSINNINIDVEMAKEILNLDEDFDKKLSV